MSNTPSHSRWLAALFLLLMAPGLHAKQAYELMTLRNDDSIANDGLYNSTLPAISTDGRFVTFRSGASQLVTPSTSQYHIFLRDSQLNTTELISANSAGTEGNNSSESSDVSDDGCLVAFESYASNLVDGDTNGTVDIFLRNRCVSPATITRISKRLDGSQTSAGNYSPDITPDGRYIAYENYELGAVRYDVINNVTLPLTGDQKQGGQPSISDDGKRIAFYCYWPLISADTNNVWDIYLWDADSGLSMVSTSSTGTLREQGDESASRIVSPAISGNGRYVSFATTAANLVTGDSNGFQDVFVKDTQTGALVIASITSSGEQGNNHSPNQQGGRAHLSWDGTWVTFESSALNLTGGTVSGGGARTVLHNIFTGETLPLDTAGNYGNGLRPAISDDPYGRFVAFFSSNSLDSRYNSSGVFRYDRHQLPIAVAKIDAATPQPIAVGATVTLDGSSSHNTPNANFFAPKTQPALTYQWSQLAGPTTVAFSSGTAAKPTFSAAVTGDYSFRLTVSDGIENSEPVTLSVTVGSTASNNNQKPLADAGSDRTVAVDSPVTLDGSGSSDPDNGPNATLSYSWTQLSGQAVNLKNSDTAVPSFTPTQAGSYSFRLVVNDGKDSSIPDVVTITVGDESSATNVPPQAVAGDDQSVNIGQQITLDGSQSFDPDSNNQLSFEWKQVGGPLVNLGNATGVTPSFTASQVGSYSFQLIVSDNEASSLPSVVTVTVGSASGNQAPVAVVSTTTSPALIGGAIKLSGSSSYDPDQTTKKLKYQWIQSDGPTTVKLTGSTSASPKFTPTAPGDYVFDLAVFDGKDWSTPASVTVHTEANVALLSPLDGEALALGSKNVVHYQTSGISAKTSLQTYLYLVDDFTGETSGYILKAKPKAKASGSFTLSIPNDPLLQTSQAVILLCVGDAFCSASGVFSIY